MMALWIVAFGADQRRNLSGHMAAPCYPFVKSDLDQATGKRAKRQTVMLRGIPSFGVRERGI
jgi:hypothetical protein